jgi:hypothetical protein
MAMILCLMVLAVLAVGGLWSLKVASLNRMAACNHVQQVQAAYLAEAGIAAAKAALRTNPLWRGDDPLVPPSGSGQLQWGNLGGVYQVTVYDATDDNNGRWDRQLPGGRLRIVSEGRSAGAYQALSCAFQFSPVTGLSANSPTVAALSSGNITVTGGANPVLAYDALGSPSAAMVMAHAGLPAISQVVLVAQADLVLNALDNNAFDASLSDRHGFWRDSPANTVPYITWIRGDVRLSGNRRLYGIVWVAGRQVSLSGPAGLTGVLYAPHALRISLPAAAAPPGPQPIMGQVLTGGDIKGTGGTLGTQLVPEYVDAFNEAAAGQLHVAMVPGSWHRP